VIPPEVEAQILRLHHAEKWPCGTIASQLAVHASVVRRVLEKAGLPRAFSPRLSMLDPFLAFVVETWKRYPTLTARRIYEMARQRGYPGRPDHFRHLVAHLRPQPAAEAFLRLQTLPGEQAQVDWGHFGKIEIGKAKRPLMAFVMVLSWSRALFLRFFLGARTADFLRGHQAAFAAFSGVARVLLYDNLKSAVLERRGDAIRFHPELLDFAGHYRYEPRPVAVARGNEKGRVERAIRYVRGSFFAARTWRDLQDLNAQARDWCAQEAAQRPWPDDPARTVGQALEEERPRLLPLPEAPYPTEERVEAVVGKTPYVRFDGNDYSVPHALVRKTLVVFADEERVRVLHGDAVVAEHARSYDRGRQVEDPRHVAALVAEKRRASQHRGADRLEHAVPQSRALLAAMAERGLPLHGAVAALVRLLDAFGAGELQAAIAEVFQGGALHPHAVRHVLERRRQDRGRPPALPPQLPDDPRVRDVWVRPHALDPYDALQGERPDDDDAHAEDATGA
jgi:transposase